MFIEYAFFSSMFWVSLSNIKWLKLHVILFVLLILFYGLLSVFVPVPCCFYCDGSVEQLEIRMDDDTSYSSLISQD